MELYLLNQSRIPIAVIDNYKSLIWTKRYYNYGDFELYIPADRTLIEQFKHDCFLTREDDTSVMLIEKLKIETDSENGNFLIISGRSLESILTRRVVVPQIIIPDSEPVQAIKMLIENNTVNSSVPNREIPGLCIDDSLMLGTTLTKQVTGDNLFDAVSAICKNFGIGIKAELSGNEIKFSFYKGREVNVVFSHEFDNLISSSYEFDYTNFADFAFAAGEGEGSERKITALARGLPSGLSRREIFVDARDISSNEGEISQADYYRQLIIPAKESLDEHNVAELFDSEVAPDITYHYKTDYNLGDIVTVKNEYGISFKPRIAEIIESWDEDGYKVVPKFEKEVN